ncbi:MAG: site-specific DNA-methyltransferase [Thermonema sp.]|uniref:site-specific DNA-methyltransferase n=1 Tax=Thermonema sp. TaxID=2231181 RepID=UPI0021DF1DC0|nr:site-specific DNA-methyltransferase [Thermonema sp.]GIV30629.1 MAG: site-specific DNA-methyltransferase [Bacteroidia bacterium]GIV40498.1 MAG: site-specific DNA-methyltransferase [Thermonema sp.]
MDKQEFIKAGFHVVGEEANENKLIKFLKENYPSVIKDNEINLQELKAIAGLPVDEKVNGYGLNFVGRNFARAKYAQKTDKELRLNTEMSKNIDTTQNLVLKGDNLDCLKILKNYYSGKIKCIYIDPPYNTDSDEFVYPDKFDKEEAEVLGLQNLSEDDFARMEFAFKTKKSHNGWLAFMYPRLLLARELLSNDGVIFISIDDNEQANLKLLCDEIFGEENFVATLIHQRAKGGGQAKHIVKGHDYILLYSKNINLIEPFRRDKTKQYKIIDKNGKKYIYNDDVVRKTFGKYNKNMGDRRCYYEELNKYKNEAQVKKIKEKINNGEYFLEKTESGLHKICKLEPLEEAYSKVYSIINSNDSTIKVLSEKGIEDLEKLNIPVFTYPKPVELIKFLIKSLPENNIILDFFAGSGTTGHAVMQLNAEDGGNRKFILCQIDEPIDEKKPAYKFCKENNLPPVISSITIERLRRAGEKIKKEIEEENKKAGMFEEHKKQVPDIGFKVFDLVDKPKLEVDDNGQIKFPEIHADTISRIYNMIFTVGLDEPTQVPEEVKKDCIYKIGNHYYITNSEKLASEDYATILKSGGKMFIDGWTASLNGTLQNYKEDVKIVF